jgi:DNA repair photolyase
MSESLALTRSPSLTEPSQSLECDTADYPIISNRDLSGEWPSRVGKAKIKPAETTTILTKATGFMGDYDFTLNPYSGCGFGCSYCYAAFFARDADLRDSWGEWVRVKKNAVELLSRPRQRAKLDGARIYMSSVTDAYQPVERQLSLTRQLLEIMAYGEIEEVVSETQGRLFSEPAPPAYEPRGHTPKLVVQTRSPDVARDIDLFRQIEANGGRVQVNMTVTTDDETVRRTFEPSCPSNVRRIEAIGEVQNAGIQSCITMTPLIWANDMEMFAERMIDTGVKRLIVQPFKFTKGNFVAQTREGAFRLMSDLLDCEPEWVHIEYQRRYERDLALLKSIASEYGVSLGEEKDGFAPPF